MAKKYKKHLEDSFLFQIRGLKLPTPERELLFHPVRKWRFDFAWPDLKLAVEINGGIWMAKGAHNTGTGILRDCQKIGAAMELGWSVYSCVDKMIKSGEAINTIEKLISLKKGDLCNKKN